MLWLENLETFESLDVVAIRAPGLAVPDFGEEGDVRGAQGGTVVRKRCATCDRRHRGEAIELPLEEFVVDFELVWWAQKSGWLTVTDLRYQC